MAFHDVRKEQIEKKINEKLQRKKEIREIPVRPARVVDPLYTARSDSPAEHTENEVHDEEGAEHHHGDEVRELPLVSQGILDLWLFFFRGWEERGKEKGEREKKNSKDPLSLNRQSSRRDLTAREEGRKKETTIVSPS